MHYITGGATASQHTQPTYSHPGLFSTAEEVKPNSGATSSLGSSLSTRAIDGIRIDAIIDMP